MSDVTRILLQIESGDALAAGQLLPLVYQELRKLAAAKLSQEKPGQTIQPTVLVHEAYLRLVDDRIIGVRCDSTGGTGDAPNEMLSTKTGLPMGQDSFFVFSTSSKNDLYVNFETALFREIGDPLRFSYPADHPLASEFEEQMIKLVREFVREGEYLSVHHPDEPGAVDDAPDCTALALFASKSGKMARYCSADYYGARDRTECAQIATGEPIGVTCRQ